MRWTTIGRATTWATHATLAGALSAAGCSVDSGRIGDQDTPTWDQGVSESASESGMDLTDPAEPTTHADIEQVAAARVFLRVDSMQLESVGVTVRGIEARHETPPHAAGPLSDHWEPVIDAPAFRQCETGDVTAVGTATVVPGDYDAVALRLDAATFEVRGQRYELRVDANREKRVPLAEPFALQPGQDYQILIALDLDRSLRFDEDGVHFEPKYVVEHVMPITIVTY